MADDLGFVPSAPAKDDLGFVPHPIAKGGDNLGFVPSSTYSPPPLPSSIQPGPDAIPLNVDQDPKSYIQAGRATPEPWRTPEQGPKPGTGITGGADWLMDALTAPGTFLGRMFQPFKEPSHDERVQERASGAPAVGNYPLIDPSIGMEPGFMKGVVQGVGGLSAPNQLPLALFSPESKAISGLFAAMTVPQATVKLAQYEQLKAAGKDAEANTVLGELATIGAFGTLAAYHTAGGGERLSTLDKEEQAYVTDALKQHYEQSIKEEVASGQPKLSEVPASTPESEGLPSRQQPSPRDQGAAPPSTQEGGVETLRDVAGTPRGEGNLEADALVSAQPQGAGGEASQGRLTQGGITSPSREDAKPIYGDSPTPNVGDWIKGKVALSYGRFTIEGPVVEVNLETGDFAIQERTTGSINNIAKNTLLGREPEEADEPTEQLEAKIKGLSTIVPDFTAAIGGTAEREQRGALPESGIAGATGDGERAGEPPFVISPAVDSDLADHGVQVTRPGPDIGKIEKYGGSMTEMVRRLSVQGHPLSSILTGIVRQGVDAIKGMMKDTTDTLGGWKRDAKTVVSDKEWMEQVVPLLKDPDVDIRTRPDNVPDNVWKAYTHTRPMLEDLRTRMRDAIRIRMLKVGLPADYVEEHVPDDWGVPFGYYPGIFEGDYAITKLHGIDENGKENWQPIETGWRDVSEAKAIAKAAAWMKDHPGVPARVQKDTYTLPGKDFSSRAKLIDLAKKLKVGDNTDLEELVSSLYDEAAAAAYGPTRIAPKQYGHALKRESNLPGGATDMESFERFIAGSIRFIHLTPAREGILQLRNKIAEIAGMPEIQRPSDIPANIAYSHATQYPNILSRTDQFISGVEGRPGFSDVELRSALNSIGADPSFMSRVGRATQEMWSLLKLGFSPVKVLSHGLQSVWAGLPVLGPRYWLEGYAHAYNPKYNDLIQSIAPSEPKFNPLIGGLEAAGNLATWKGSPNTLVEALHTYNADYFSRGTGPIDWTKGLYHLVRDIGMSPFAAGIETTRRSGAVGAYRKALDSGLPEAQARDFASAAVDRISGLYHAADNPTVLRNLPGPIAQFKTFSFKTAQMMYGFRTPAEWTYFLGAIGLLGFAGIPFIKPLSGIALALSGEDVENDLKRKFPVASRGIFGAAGVDIPPGVGVGDLGLTRPQAPLGGILGPAGSDIYSLAKGGLEKAFDPVSRKGDQDFKDAIRNLSPAARRLMDESDRTVANPSTVDPHTGSTILQHLTPLERLEMEGGFTPLRVAEERESHEYIRNLIANEKDKHGFFVDHMAANAIRLSQPGLTHEQQMDIVKDTVALGRMAAEEYGIKVEPKGVLERAREMTLERLHRDFKLAPKAVRPQIYEEMQRFQQEQK